MGEKALILKWILVIYCLIFSFSYITFTFFFLHMLIDAGSNILFTARNWDRAGDVDEQRWT